MKRAMFICLLCSALMFGAFNANTKWDVRTTGNNSNGGGFQSDATGTDYSQQDTPQYSYVDILIGVTTTQATSVARPFSAVDPGNIINITAGAGCTVQRVQVVSQVAGVATFDKSLGTSGSTCTGNLGGSLASIATAPAVDYNVVYIKSGTYTLTSTVTFPAYYMTYVGYQTSHQDNGTKPLITTATNSTVLFYPANGGGYYNFVNLAMSNTAAIRADAIQSTRGGDQVATIINCTFDGFNRAVGNTGGANTFNGLRIIATEIKNSVGDGVWNYYYATTIIESYIHNNGGNGLQVQANDTNSPIEIIRSIFAYNTGDGYHQNSANNLRNRLVIHDSVFAHNGGDGIQPGNAGGGQEGIGFIDLAGNVFYANTGYGVNNPISPNVTAFNQSNAYGANTAGRALNMPIGNGEVTLTADPFTNSGTGDYSLNNTTGGGALLRQKGFPGVFPGGTTTGYLDIGAAQSQGIVVGATGSAFVQ